MAADRLQPQNVKAVMLLCANKPRRKHFAAPGLFSAELFKGRINTVLLPKIRFDKIVFARRRARGSTRPLNKIGKRYNTLADFGGGGGGSRTRVRKLFHIYFSGCRLLFKLPAGGRRQPSRRVRYLPYTMAVRKKLPSSFTVSRRLDPVPRYSPARRQA